MDRIAGVFDLLLQTLASLTAGYLGYRIAYNARDMTHKAIDVVFFVTVFAFFARAASHLAALFFGTILGPQESPVSIVINYLTMIGAIKRAPQY